MQIESLLKPGLHLKTRDSEENVIPAWLSQCMAEHRVVLWGAADLKVFSTPRDETGQGFDLALSWAFPMNPRIMADIRNGPNQDYADEYSRVNHQLNSISTALAAEFKQRGYRSLALAASSRTDTVNIQGDFPHKTAATRAGIGMVSGDTP